MCFWFKVIPRFWCSIKQSCVQPIAQSPVAWILVILPITSMKSSTAKTTSTASNYHFHMLIIMIKPMKSYVSKPIKTRSFSQASVGPPLNLQWPLALMAFWGAGFFSWYCSFFVQFHGGWSLIKKLLRKMTHLEISGLKEFLEVTQHFFLWSLSFGPLNTARFQTATLETDLKESSGGWEEVQPNGTVLRQPKIAMSSLEISLQNAGESSMDDTTMLGISHLVQLAFSVIKTYQNQLNFQIWEKAFTHWLSCCLKLLPSK